MTVNLSSKKVDFQWMKSSNNKRIKLINWIAINGGKLLDLECELTNKWIEWINWSSINGID